MKRNDIYLTVEQQEQLQAVVSNKELNLRMITRARVLLMLDRTGKMEHIRYKQIAEYIGVSVKAVYDMRDDYIAKQDITAYLTRKKRETPPVPPKVTGEVEAQVVALACSEKPEGYARWSLRLLSKKAVELGCVDSISHSTVGDILKKTNTNLT